ncbi:MAG: UDP-N-acetylmuramate--L-alanine ligase [Planctomycetes bacterium]|nr:UDP-N-acetylmuramate--L-alanine ligase [Planctomycetota bacterium]
MGRPNTAKLEKSETENRINPPESIDSVVNIEAPAAGIAGKRFHFIGAGGVGMSGLAQLLIKNSGLVTGSDQEQTTVTDRLCEMGAFIKIGHNADNLDPAADAVVISAAINQDNPELIMAREKGLKIYKYAQMLGQLCNCYDGIAVAGTHGKSTTSGWLAYCLKQAGIDANYIIGADVIQLGGSSGAGESKLFVAEACEYDRSFLNLKPKIGCILNIEQDHLDYYKDEDEIVDTFCDFALGIKPDGVLIANGEDSNVAKVISRLPADFPCQTFGLDKDCNFYADNIQLNDGFYTFDAYQNGKLLGPARNSLPGTHNILNALAVVAMAINAGLDPARIIALMPNFTGIDRRLMLKGQVRQITVLDDYAHHPTEIRASLAAISQRYQPERIFCVFQPHQYSRTRFLLNDFSESFKLADVTIVPEIYFVRDSQAAKKEVNSQILVDKIRDNGTQAVFIDGFGPICDYLNHNLKPGDLVVTMGAGDIWKVADEYLQRLRDNS